MRSFTIVSTEVLLAFIRDLAGAIICIISITVLANFSSRIGAIS